MPCRTLFHVLNSSRLEGKVQGGRLMSGGVWQNGRIHMAEHFCQTLYGLAEGLDSGVKSHGVVARAGPLTIFWFLIWHLDFCRSTPQAAGALRRALAEVGRSDFKFVAEVGRSRQKSGRSRQKFCQVCGRTTLFSRPPWQGWWYHEIEHYFILNCDAYYHIRRNQDSALYLQI